MLEQVNGKNGRFYLFTDENGEKHKLPSVTTVTRLSNEDNVFLQKWLLNPENQLSSEYSMMFGRAVHSHIECYFSGYDYQDENQNKDIFDFWVESFKPPNDFDKHQTQGVYQTTKEFFENVFMSECDTLKPSVIACEESLASLQFKVAGTPDLLVKVYNPDSLCYKLRVYDFKTANKRKQGHHLSNYGMQLAIYSVMAKEKYNLPIECATLLIGIIPSQKLQKVDMDVLDLSVHLGNFCHWRDIYADRHGF